MSREHGDDLWGSSGHSACRDEIDHLRAQLAAEQARRGSVEAERDNLQFGADTLRWRAEAADACAKAYRSICAMLGWGNTPPLATMEREINAMKARIRDAEAERDRLRGRLAAAVAYVDWCEHIGTWQQAHDGAAESRWVLTPEEYEEHERRTDEILSSNETATADAAEAQFAADDANLQQIAGTVAMALERAMQVARFRNLEARLGVALDAMQAAYDCEHNDAVCGGGAAAREFLRQVLSDPTNAALVPEIAEAREGWAALRTLLSGHTPVYRTITIGWFWGYDYFVTLGNQSLRHCGVTLFDALRAAIAAKDQQQ